MDEGTEKQVALRSLHAKEVTDEERREAASRMGSARGGKKAEAARENALKGGKPEGYKDPDEVKEKKSAGAKAMWERRRAAKAAQAAQEAGNA